VGVFESEHRGAAGRATIGTFAFVLWLSLGAANSPALAQADAALPNASSPEQLQAEIEFHKADAKYQRELSDRLSAENKELRARVEGIEAPVFAKEVDARLREIDLKEKLYAKYVEAKQREYDFASEMMTVNAYIFQHQYVAAYVILALVVLVVTGGLWFAKVQLMAGLMPAQAVRRATDPAAPDPTAAASAAEPAPASPIVPSAPPGTTTIDASFEKITVTSSVVGIIVLLISLAFLYIYTKEIYTIRIVDPYQPKLANPFDPGDPSRQKTSGEKK
jgi:hypothetical protein